MTPTSVQADAEPSLLALEGITKRFGSFTALDDVSFDLRSGSVHALLGENGAGKTTLMRVAFGLLQPDAGQIAVAGKRETFSSPAAAIDAGVGMVHQQFSLIPAMTVAENIALGGRGNLAIRNIVSTIKSLSDRTGLRLDPFSRVADLRPADRQKLEILRTLAHDARILILDEPTAVLTEKDISDLFGQIRQYAAAGNGVVLITHKLRDALKHADQITILRRGKVVYSARADESDELTLTAAMIGEGDRKRSVSQPKPGITPERLVEVLGVEIRKHEILGVAALEGAAKPLIRALADLPMKTGFVPENRQDDALIQSFTLTENLALTNAAERKGILHWSAIEEAARQIIEMFSVKAPGVDARPDELSGGNQQRFVLARELHGNPDLLVLENPTQGLDLNATAFVHDQMRAATDRGAAVIFYSSDLDELAAVSDRVVVVSENRATEVPAIRDNIGSALLAS